MKNIFQIDQFAVEDTPTSTLLYEPKSCNNNHAAATSTTIFVAQILMISCCHVKVLLWTPIYLYLKSSTFLRENESCYSAFLARWQKYCLCHLLSDCFWRYVNVRARYQKISSIGKCHKPFYIFEIKTNKLSMRERIRFLCIAFRVI